MRVMKNILIILILLSTNFVFAQNNIDFKPKQFKNDLAGLSQAQENIKEGDKYYLIGKGTYFKAIPFYLKANTFNENNSKLNFKIAICYLFSDTEIMAIKYFNISKKLQGKDKTTVNYYLGLSYQKNYQPKKAIEKYNEFIDDIPLFKKNKWKKKTEKRIYECENAISFQKNPKKNKIENLGAKVNTEFSEQNPILFIGTDSLIFTSRKKEGNIAPDNTDSVDFQKHEDVFVFSQNSISLYSSVLKYPNHDALIYKNNNSSITYLSENGGDLYLYENNLQTALPKQINTPYHESSAVLSNDGNIIYFTTNKKGNYDIYFSEKNEKGKWQKAKPLSENINTEYNEKGLFLHPNGKTLYFASTGHNSMGGYDIFFSTKQDDNEWSEPKNLGYPINSIDDDIFFTVSVKEKIAYFASNRKEGYGKMDIYKTDINETFFNLNLLKIIVKNKKNELIDAEIKILSNDDNEAIVDSKTKKGKYQTPIKSGKKYTLIVNSKDYMFYTQNFDIQEKNKYNETIIEVVLSKVKANEQIVLTNVEFNYASAKLKTSSYKYLDEMALYLIANPKYKTEISGHTDNTGNYDDNQKLSEERAKSVVDYLVEKGVPSENLSSVGYSSDKPIADNSTAEGREKNRRVEFKIIK